MNKVCTVIRTSSPDFELFINGVVEKEFERMKQEKNAQIEARDRALAYYKGESYEQYILHKKEVEDFFADFDSRLGETTPLYIQIAGEVVRDLEEAKDIAYDIFWYIRAWSIEFGIMAKLFPRSALNAVRLYRACVRKHGLGNLKYILRHVWVRFCIDMGMIVPVITKGE